MDLPRERLLLMVVVLTAFVVLVGGWAGAFAHAQLSGLTEGSREPPFGWCSCSP